MYRALYAFRSAEPNALPFAAGETFLILERSNRHWWLGSRCSSGETGYIPASYIERIQAPEQDVVLQSVDRAIEAVHNVAMKNGGRYNLEQRDVLQKLIHHRKETLARRSPTPVNRKHTLPASTSDLLLSHTPQPPNGLSRSPAPQPPASSPSNPEEQSEPKCALAPPPESAHAISVPLTTGAELIELVRRNTNLSYELSRVAVGVVVGHLQTAVPQAANALEQVLLSLVGSKVRTAGQRFAVRFVAAVQTPAPRLQTDEAFIDCVFGVLNKTTYEETVQRKQQQLQVYERHAGPECGVTSRTGVSRRAAARGDLRRPGATPGGLAATQLGSTDADPEVCRRMCRANQFEAVLSLVTYYQMEHRVSLRLLLLKVFGAMCSLDPALISTLLNSILPMELARDLHTDTQEHQKMCYSALVLSMIFSMGEQLPFHHYEQLNESFVLFLLEVIEDGLPSDPTEQLPDLFVTLLLAFNLHFTVPDNNVIMQTLIKRHNAKILTEKILLLLNRGDDPVCVFTHAPPAPHAVLKFLQDIFASRDSAHIFYHTDMMVMIDIILRMEYLSLMHAVIRSTDYAEHRHRLDDLQRALQRILDEEEEEGGGDEGGATARQMDKLIVQEIYREFPLIGP
ncbi:hypothetical protein Z043_125027, partial [Scleropages formosus]